MNKVPIY